MSVGERDPFTGHITTGHEWNGITELNTPVPRVVTLSLIITAALGLVWTVLMPSWPFVTSYFPGVLGIDQRNVVANSVAEAQAERSPWMSSIEDQDFSAILSNPELMRIVRENGRTLFGDNCAACHGHDARANAGSPTLRNRRCSGETVLKRSCKRSQSGSTAQIRTRGCRRCWRSVAMERLALPKSHR